MPSPPFTAGDVVTVRGHRWIIEEVLSFSGCTLLHLAGADPARQRAACRLLHPFDRPIRQKLHPRVRLAAPQRWLQTLQSHVADCRLLGQLHAAAGAAIDIFPFQLEPALAVVRGLACRVLIADEVGLGKTIQAGLILSELRERGWCERALIVTPAGLREQWADELDRRFHIHAAIFDAASLREMASILPAEINPWAVESTAVTSIDFVKQPEVLRALTSLTWDLVIIDEAHQIPTAPQRAAAVDSLTRRARHVVLLTATPHAGDDAAYQSLCGIGAVDAADPLILFRRTRIETGRGRPRRVHLLSVRLSGDEMDMHRLLTQYAKQVWQIGLSRGEPELQLIATVLTKRALSSASSLALSVQRRLNGLSSSLPPPGQSGLPFESDEDPSDTEPALSSAAFERPADERAALTRILAAAERAAGDERKIAAVRRLLRRVREPAIVFTEYRDTLATLESRIAGLPRPVLLHGGMDRHQRRLTVDAFTHGNAHLLLATDAGAEGLNLQRHCRLVINLELPWNPVRLEQRIGRVDRLGQTRQVHAVNLFAAGTAEDTVLAGLQRRIDRVRTEADIALEVIHADRSGPSSGS